MIGYKENDLWIVKFGCARAPLLWQNFGVSNCEHYLFYTFLLIFHIYPAKKTMNNTCHMSYWSFFFFLSAKFLKFFSSVLHVNFLLIKNIRTNLFCTGSNCCFAIKRNEDQFQGKKYFSFSCLAFILWDNSDSAERWSGWKKLQYVYSCKIFYSWLGLKIFY